MKPNLIEMLAQQKQLNPEDSTKRVRRCPVCSETELVRTERQGVEIDSCPRCRGVWLDRNGLEKLVDACVNGRAWRSRTGRQPAMS